MCPQGIVQPSKHVCLSLCIYYIFIHICYNIYRRYIDYSAWYIGYQTCLTPPLQLLFVRFRFHTRTIARANLGYIWTRLRFRSALTRTFTGNVKREGRAWDMQVGKHEKFPQRFGLHWCTGRYSWFNASIRLGDIPLKLKSKQRGLYLLAAMVLSRLPIVTRIYKQGLFITSIT